ncbi:long-chain fatty acid--CoA ligase [Alcanivorax sp. N3-2A]|nr:long-chain fatty acid--CoA ligase [Alcanivorax sp. N3-2A]|tara:strand:- start:35248 stop:36909 length:1662 start_codon:yes stop_codon:yes gene_type:complete
MDSPDARFFPKGMPARLTVPSLTLGENLEAAARRFPERAALVFYDGVLTYRDLLGQVRAMAGFLQQHCGVVRGDRVLLLSQNCPQFVIAFYATVSLGAAVVPVNAMSTSAELDHYVGDSGARVAFCAQELYSQLRPCMDAERLHRVVLHSYSDYLGDRDNDSTPGWVRAPARAIDDPALVSWRDALAMKASASAERFANDQLCVLPYTSGTTGTPKGCLLDHRNLMTAIYASSVWRALNAECVFLSVAPMFHMLGLQSSMNLPIMLGATSVIMPRWDRDLAADLIQRWRVNIWGAPPAMIMDFFAKQDLTAFDLTSLTLIFGGGAAMPEAVARTLSDDHGITFNESYGLTETAAFLHANPVSRNKRQCLGVATFGVLSRVVDPETGEPLPDGEVGELITHGEQVMHGYWNNDQANREAFLQRDGLRFFRTGDLAYRDEDGYFFLVDRLKRMISVSGYKVWPAEIENFMYHHPAVREACVISVPDEKSGERVEAVIVLKEGPAGQVSEQQIIDWARQKMAVYKAPRRVVFVDSLPKSGAGKVLWRQIQEEHRLA